jgi:hypothetical protein
MEVVKINVQQNLETDSDPGKITITLANRHQMYTNKWPPQVTEIKIILYNWVYRGVDDYPAPRSMATYLVATGKMVSNSADQKEAVVEGECDLGHLADAIPNDTDQHAVTPKEAIKYILDKHPDYPIEFDWDPALDDRNRFKERETFGSDWTFQDFLDDICGVQLGAIYYFNEENRLQIKDPYSDVGVYNLDPYVTTPMQTTSVMGFRNAVVVIGDESKTLDPKAISVQGSKPIISDKDHGIDWESVGEVGWLIAPVFRDHCIKDISVANQKADELLKFYKMNKNALTIVDVVGIVPPLQSIVEYTPFIPISQGDQDKMNAELKDALTDLQNAEHGFAVSQDRLERKVALSSKVRGIVINKVVDYSIDGLKCKLTISPGMVDGTPITDDDVSGSVINWTDINGGD